MALQLSDLSFEIANATLVGELADPHWCDNYNGGLRKELTWWVNVKTKPREVEGVEWKPSLETGYLKIEVSDWRRIEGVRLAWNEPFDPVSGDDNGSIYVFEHEDILRSELEFRSRRGSRFSLDWKGSCNIRWGGPYNTNVPFALHTDDLRFTEIRVRGSGRDRDEDLARRLGERISLVSLVPGKVTREPQTQRCHQTFSPADDQ